MGKSTKSAAQPIVAAIDFSTYSARALLWAARAAECFAAPLVIVHVVHDPGSAPGYYNRPKKRAKHLRRIEESADQMLGDFLADVRKKNPDLPALAAAEVVLVVGLPVTRIIEVATKRDACLVVMGSQGRTGLHHLLLGSKAESVVQLSPIPVTIVKDPKPDKGKH